MSVPDVGAVLAGKYVLHRRLGAGGYGAVFEGENVDLGKRVAIKVIARRHAQSLEGEREAIARFRREARANAKIESANIVQVFDVGEDPAAGLYMVMELLRGEDLRHKIDRVGHLDVEFAVDVAHQILCGLAKAHAVGIVHRDLKPANVFLHKPSAEDDEDDQRVIAKLVDFGVAKLLDDALLGDANPVLTVAGKTVGTPQYMCPEQVQGLPVDHRGDLWSVGALLYEMITGTPAFAMHDTFQETALAIVNDTPTPISALARGVPSELIAVVARALAKDPDQRFADATMFADALMNAVPLNDPRAEARVAEIVSVRPLRPKSLPPPAPREEPRVVVGSAIDRRSLGVWIAIGVLGVAAAILVLAALRTPSAKRAEPRASASGSSPPIDAEPEPEPEAEVEAEAEAEAEAATDTASTLATKPDAPPPKPPEQFGGTGISGQF